MGCYQFAGAAPHPVDLSGLMENIWKLSFLKAEILLGILAAGIVD